MPEAHVRLVDLTKRFAPGAQPAVDNVSLEIPPGSFTTFLGPSGCGKTTTLRMIAGFYEPDHGDIYIGPRRINDVPAHRRKTAMVFQDYALFPHMTVADNVGYGLRLARLIDRASTVEWRRRCSFSDSMACSGAIRISSAVASNNASRSLERW